MERIAWFVCGILSLSACTPRSLSFSSVPPSCVGLEPTCGADEHDDCCNSPGVAGGSLERGCDPQDTQNIACEATHAHPPKASFPATVSNFRLDKYEISVGRFRNFVAAGQGTAAQPPPPHAGARTLNGQPDQAGWDPAWDQYLAKDTDGLRAALQCEPTHQTWTDAAGPNENLPINCINWYEAMAFCIWDGGFLPTEAQWQYAAVGGSEGRRYPWSHPPSSLVVDCAHANHRLEPPGDSCVSGGGVNHVGSESPLGDGSWGQSDLAGNLAEWTLDWFNDYTGECTDCANLAHPTTAEDRVVRGGDFADSVGTYDFYYHPNQIPTLRGAYRNLGTPTVPAENLGARCARRLTDR